MVVKVRFEISSSSGILDRCSRNALVTMIATCRSFDCGPLGSAQERPESNNVAASAVTTEIRSQIDRPANGKNLVTMFMSRFLR